MKKLIVDYPDDMPMSEVLLYVREHTREGYISEAAGVPHYCWVTSVSRIGGGVLTWIRTRRKKRGQTTDSLSIENGS